MIVEGSLPRRLCSDTTCYVSVSCDVSGAELLLLTSFVHVIVSCHKRFFKDSYRGNLEAISTSNQEVILQIQNVSVCVFLLVF